MERSNVVNTNEEQASTDAPPEVYSEDFLIPALEGEVARARRYSHEFALILSGVHELNKRFDYRDEALWEASFNETAKILGRTRLNIDLVFRYGTDSFALLLPESGPAAVRGLASRLRRLARNWSPAEGEPGGPLPLRFGATFYPACAATADGLIKRANVALLLADRNQFRLHLDGAGGCLESSGNLFPRASKMSWGFKP